MIEIKFTTENNDKHLAIFAPETAARIHDVASLITDKEVFAKSNIYSIKECDIAEIFDRTADDDADEGAYYKAVVKYVSVDDKVIKYSFLTWARDMADARERTESIIKQNDLSLAEVTKLEKSNYTEVINDAWLLYWEQKYILVADGYTLDVDEGCVYFVETREAVMRLNAIGEQPNVMFRFKHKYTNEPAYHDSDDNTYHNLYDNQLVDNDNIRTFG